jgi:hypothetical protein
MQPGVARVKTSSLRTQGVRRQMAKYSERNLYSNIATVLHFNFVPGEWVDRPDNLPAGAKLAHELIERAWGMKMHPVPSWQVLNYDFSSYYTWKGTSHRTGEGDTWNRVSVESLDRGLRNTTSIKKNGEESVCNGITVNWMDCGTASGLILPIVQIFEHF